MAWSATIAASVAVGIGVVVAKAERERRAARKRVLERERRFGLRRGETTADGLRRIALGQIDLAIEMLSGSQGSIPPEQAVHETRKALKRLRALMLLLEDEIGSRRAKREREMLRDAAKRLAGVRDAEVMVKTLDGLIDRQGRKFGRKRGVIELREHLERERRAARAQAARDGAAHERVTEELRELRADVQRWRLSERPVRRLTRPGLEHIYRAGRNGYARVRAGRRNARAMHRWRKHVKDLRYALEALDVQDPPDDRGDSPPSKRGKRAGRRIAGVAERADTLGELLGEEHDLVVLAGRIRAHKPLRRRRRVRKQLLRAIARRRAQLRKRALRKGKGLYERKPKRFVRRVHT
jgi:CHAD domain-containing protein